MPRRALPPLSALATFEEVAIRRSCSEAAHHLGLTQSAVSKQIQAMERFIGLPLFSRTKGGLIPNAIGTRLLGDIQPLLDDVERVCSRASREGTNRKVVIMRVLAMIADRWLLPRLGAFLEAHPDIDVQFSTFLVSSEFDRGGAEIEIRFGAGPWLDADSTPLVGRERVLIAPPGTPPDLPLEELFKRPRFIHAQSPDVWREFCEANRLPLLDDRQIAQSFDISQVLIKAVRVGMGIAMMSRCLVAEELERGELVNPGGYSYQSRLGYHVLVPHRARPLSKAAQTLLDWIRAQAEDH
ncbi:MAG: LysR substrate-binding domain-containing protein [Beijerinckiaceae bacterium]|nr:LysR substrate-binding domain-containing protein [Beijerinckiaceae bacterium]MCZ8300045.1 LysR substrate-binding domain-containing protein [Beijerinckiaceae bacterium]